MEVVLAAPFSASSAGRSWAVPIILILVEGAPPVSDLTIESLLEDEESLEVFIASSNREKQVE
jgi:hypothetical protein